MGKLKITMVLIVLLIFLALGTANAADTNSFDNNVVNDNSINGNFIDFNLVDANIVNDNNADDSVDVNGVNDNNLNGNGNSNKENTSNNDYNNFKDSNSVSGSIIGQSFSTESSLNVQNMIIASTPVTYIINNSNYNDFFYNNGSIKSGIMILNPKYRDELLKSASGWLSYSEKYEYIFGFVSTATGKGGKSLISDSVWNGLAKNLLDSSFNVNSDYKSASFQSMAGWILVAAQKGMFKADPKVLQEIIDKYINATRNYGVACCHHTCANLEFNKWVVQASSLSYNEKKEFLEELQSSTKVKYDVSAILGTERYEGQLQEWGSQDLSGYQGKSQYSPNTQGAMNPDGGSGDISSAGESGANGPNGEAGTSGDSSSQGDQSSSAAGQGDSKSYEVDKNQQNTSGEESGVSAAFIVAVLALIGLFVVGYVRNKSEE